MTLGVTGQLIRVFIGLKKDYDDANKEGKKFNEFFDKNQLLLSIGIAIAIGAIAGVLGIIQYSGQDITQNTLIAVIGVGYAGTDFIEGLLLNNKPK